MDGFLSKVAKAFGVRENSSSGKNLSINSEKEFAVVFNSQSLGITITELDGLPVVESVHMGSEAAKNSVKKGDQLVAVEGNPIRSFDDFSSFVPGFDYRPLTMRFKRRAGASNGLSRETTATYDNEPVLSEEEKEQRRIAMIQAVEIRNKQTNPPRHKKKMTDGSVTGNAGVEGAETRLNEETERLVKNVKKEEERMVRELGYNPFRVHMSSVTEAKVQIDHVKHGDLSNVLATSETIGSASGSGSFGEGGRQIVNGVLQPRYPPSTTLVAAAGVMRSAQDAQEEALGYGGGDFGIDEEAAHDIDEAISMLISGSDQSASEQALRTVLKILTSLLANTDNPKYRTIRMQNPKFHERVMVISGGLELMLAAGFYLNAAEKPDGQGQMTDSKATDQASIRDSTEELFFHHPCHVLPEARGKLLHANLRISETLQSLYPYDATTSQSQSSQPELRPGSASKASATPETRPPSSTGPKALKSGDEGRFATDGSADESKRERMLKAFEQRNKNFAGSKSNTKRK